MLAIARGYERVAPRIYDLPTGVYHYGTKGNKSKKFQARLWIPTLKKEKSVGVYVTPEEASYRRRLKKHGHHWQQMPNVPMFGFIYEMLHVPTGKKYIGSKQKFFWDGPVGGWKCTDIKSKHFDSSMWKESDWREYKSSAKAVSAAATEAPWEWEYRVLSTHNNKLSLALAEVQHQIDNEVLTATDDNGDYAYLNGNILGAAYRPPVPLEKLVAQREASAKAMQDYYLKPATCEKCGELIPFGDTQCPNAPLFGAGECDARTNND